MEELFEKYLQKLNYTTGDSLRGVMSEINWNVGKMKNIFFEVEGKDKNEFQIKGLKNAFIVSRNIEIGSRNKIPLWLFGFRY